MLALSKESGSFYMAVPVLAEILGVEPSTVRRIIRRLERGGWIVCAERGGQDGRSPSVYEVQESRIQEAAEEAAKARAKKRAKSATEQEPEGKKSAAEGAQSACPGAGPLPGQGAQDARQVYDMSRDYEALLAQVFGRVTENRRREFLRAMDNARKAGVSGAWIGNYLLNAKPAERATSPFRAVDEGIDKAKEVVRAATAATDAGSGPRQRFEDLAHVIRHIQAGGEDLPPSKVLPGVRGRDGGPLKVSAVVKAATAWPEAAEAAAPPAGQSAERVEAEGG